MDITGLDHMQLAMPAGAEDAARAFYGQLLGLREIAKPEALRGRGGCWFALPGAQLHLGVEAEFAPARKAHPAFLVADLAALVRRLDEAGVATTPDTAVAGVRRCYTSDPFGNRIELIQHGDGFAQRGG